MTYSVAEVRQRIEEAARKLGLDAQALMQEYGVTTALAEMLEEESRMAQKGYIEQ